MSIASLPGAEECATCGFRFAGVPAFDRHRRNGKCLDPAAIGLFELVSRGGAWGVPATRAGAEWFGPLVQLSVLDILSDDSLSVVR